MQTILLNDFFNNTNFNYNTISDKLFTVNKITKTRVDNNKTLVTQHYGIEQSFLLYYVSKMCKANNILEIGTGRGTGSYSFSLDNNSKTIHTFDIVPFTKKVHTAVNFKPFYGSNKDLYDLIPYSEKEKIQFKHINELNDEYKKDYKNFFDLAFIDGNHDNYNIIMNDFHNCNFLTNENGVIIFDDYGNFPVVTNVINNIVENNPEFKFIKIPFRGHLFMKDKACNKSSEVILFKNPKMLDLFNSNIH